MARGRFEPSPTPRKVEHTDQTETRIVAMMAEMRALKWRKGESGPRWAKKLGLSLDRIEHLSGEAWQRVKAEALDRDRISVKVSSVLEKVIDEALVDATEKNAARRVVVEASKAWAAIVGADAPQRVQVTAATPAEAARLMREAFGPVTPVGANAAVADGDAEKGRGDPGEGSTGG